MAGKKRNKQTLYWITLIIMIAAFVSVAWTAQANSGDFATILVSPL